YDGHLFGNYTSQVTWMNRIMPYVQSGASKKSQLFFCPSDSEKNSSSDVWTTNVSYCYNYYFLAGSGTGAGGVNVAAIPNVAETVLFAETAGRAGSRYTCLPANNKPTAPHFDGGNFAFVDGHVKWYRNPGPLYNNQDFWKLD